MSVILTEKAAGEVAVVVGDETGYLGIHLDPHHLPGSELKSRHRIMSSRGPDDAGQLVAADEVGEGDGVENP